MRLSGSYDEALTRPLPHDELVQLQRRAAEARHKPSPKAAVMAVDQFDFAAVFGFLVSLRRGPPDADRGEGVGG